MFKDLMIQCFFLHYVIVISSTMCIYLGLYGKALEVFIKISPTGFYSNQ